MFLGLLCFFVLLSRLCGHLSEEVIIHFNRAFFDTFGGLEKWEGCMHVIRMTPPLAFQMAVLSRHRLPIGLSCLRVDFFVKFYYIAISPLSSCIFIFCVFSSGVLALLLWVLQSSLLGDLLLSQYVSEFTTNPDLLNFNDFIYFFCVCDKVVKSH